MSYNGSGTFQINTSGQPVVAGTVISATAFNALTADLATGLSTAITKDGQTTTTARIPFAAGISSTLVTDSSSVSTGSIITAGGVGIAKNLYVGVNANIAGTLGVTGVATFSAAPIYSSLTASSAVATDASKGLVSVTNTGTGSNVLATSPTLVTPILGTPQSGTLTNCTGLPTTALTGAITEANGGTGTTTGYYGFKNRIINGAMVIDQRNAGASVTATTDIYTLDRWRSLNSVTSKYTVEQTVTGVAAPTGFADYLGVTSSAATSVGSTDYYVIRQYIEGFNFFDMAWGTASASTVTLSFWVRSSLTGTFGGAFSNAAANRTYPFSYTISLANTWEQKTVTVAGDTTGTWIGATNAAGCLVSFSLGAGSTLSGTAGSWAAANYASATGATSVVGTNGATFYITGVQLEKGSTATSFDYRPYGTELALCQRYYIKINNPGGGNAGYGPLVGAYTSIRSLAVPYCLPVPMRVNGGSFVIAFSNVSLYAINLSTSYAVTSIAAWSGDYSTPSIDIGVASGLTAGTSYIFTINSNGFISYSAEL
jgi:hypothetical protein